MADEVNNNGNLEKSESSQGLTNQSGEPIKVFRIEGNHLNFLVSCIFLYIYIYIVIISFIASTAYD